MEVLREGYRIPFQRAPTLSGDPIPFSAYCPNSIRGKALEQEVESLLQKGALELAPLPSLGYYSQSFCGDESLRVLAAGNRPFPIKSQGVKDAIQDGDYPVHSVISPQRGLDGSPSISRTHISRFQSIRSPGGI